MKKIFMFLFLMLVLVSSALPQAGAPHKRYQVERGIIEYDISGNQPGKAVVYFDHWGMREARYTVSRISVYGQQRMLTLLEGDWIITVDLDKRIGRKVQNAVLTDYLARPASSGETFDESMMEWIGGERIGAEDIHGRRCEVWEIKSAGTRTWYWRWIPLKVNVFAAGSQMSIRAIRIEEGAEIPEEKFVIPADVQFVNEDINNIIISLRR